MLIVARKSPGVATSGAFLFRCGKVAYALGWLPPIYLRPAICRCSRRLHLPRQRVRKTKIYSWWHTPFLYLYRGGSVTHYTIVAEMPQEAISLVYYQSHKEKSVKGGHQTALACQCLAAIVGLSPRDISIPEIVTLQGRISLLHFKFNCLLRQSAVVPSRLNWRSSGLVSHQARGYLVLKLPLCRLHGSSPRPPLSCIMTALISSTYWGSVLLGIFLYSSS